MIKSHDTIVKQSSRAMNYAAAKKKKKRQTLCWCEQVFSLFFPAMMWSVRENGFAQKTFNQDEGLERI